MRILYGVQGTGNGHITRARAMAGELHKAGLEVVYLVSGRPRQALFDMDVFGSFEWREGLTFRTRAGRVQYLKSALHASPVRFLRDVKGLDLSRFDLVISDFEPVTAWAGRLHGITTIGIGHQYAFAYDIPKTGEDFLTRRVMRYFAPVDIGLGLHWHHFDQPILPPMIEPPPAAATVRRNTIVVYLPFEDPARIVDVLAPFDDHAFHVYTPIPVQDPRPRPNITFKPLSRHDFQQDMSDCSGVICNAGFELASEALTAGKKLLVKPLHRQMEQLSNALALETLDYGRAMHALDPDVIADWLTRGRRVRIRFPNVARSIVAWLAQGDWRIDHGWIADLWRQAESVARED